MSIVRDYGWYYDGTYIGLLNSESVVKAFYVEHIGYDGDDEPEDGDFFDDDLDHVYLYGYTFDDEGRNKQYDSLALDDQRLVLKMPQLGMCEVPSSRGREYHYLSYVPQRSVKKGFCDMRCSGSPSGLDAKSINAIFANGFEASPKCPFRIVGEKIMYKFDTCIGTYTSSENWCLTPSANYLLDKFKRTLSDANNPAGVRS